MKRFFKKIGDFFHRIWSDLSHIHVRAAFADVEHRISHLLHHHGHHFKEPDFEEEIPE